MKDFWWKGGYTPGIKTADQPVLLDVPDSLDVLQGVGMGGLNRVRRVYRVGGLELISMRTIG